MDIYFNFLSSTPLSTEQGPFCIPWDSGGTVNHNAFLLSGKSITFDLDLIHYVFSSSSLQLLASWVGM